MVDPATGPLDQLHLVSLHRLEHELGVRGALGLQRGRDQLAQLDQVGVDRPLGQLPGALAQSATRGCSRTTSSSTCSST